MAPVRYAVFDSAVLHGLASSTSRAKRDRRRRFEEFGRPCDAGAAPVSARRRSLWQKRTSHARRRPAQVNDLAALCAHDPAPAWHLHCLDGLPMTGVQEPAWIHVAGPATRALVDELRLCSNTLLRALVSASLRCSGGALRLGFDELARAHSVQQAALFGALPASTSPHHLSEKRLVALAWIAARGILPDADDRTLVERCADLARDLAARSEDLRACPLPEAVARRVHLFAAATRVLGARIAAQGQPT
jgi:hypothetical protein